MNKVYYQGTCHQTESCPAVLTPGRERSNIKRAFAKTQESVVSAAATRNPPEKTVSEFRSSPPLLPLPCFPRFAHAPSRAALIWSPVGRNGFFSLNWCPRRNQVISSTTTWPLAACHGSLGLHQAPGSRHHSFWDAIPKPDSDPPADCVAQKPSCASFLRMYQFL